MPKITKKQKEKLKKLITRDIQISDKVIQRPDTDIIDHNINSKLKLFRKQFDTLTDDQILDRVKSIHFDIFTQMSFSRQTLHLLRLIWKFRKLLLRRKS